MHVGPSGSQFSARATSLKIYGCSDGLGSGCLLFLALTLGRTRRSIWFEGLGFRDFGYRVIGLPRDQILNHNKTKRKKTQPRYKTQTQQLAPTANFSKHYTPTPQQRSNSTAQTLNFEPSNAGKASDSKFDKGLSQPRLWTTGPVNERLKVHARKRLDSMYGLGA